MAPRVVLGGSVGIQRESGEIEEAGPGRLARLTLAYLVSERRPVSREELADVLWGEDLPASWDQMVRGAVSSVRGLLRHCELPAESLETAHGGYHLRLPAGVRVDVEDAAAHLAAAESMVAEGDGAGARHEAEAAVAVASRQFAPGTTGRWAERRQAELREMHLRSLEALAGAAEGSGHWGLAAQAAEEAVGIEPFRESAYRLLMSAHARAGHRGEALRAYERCRRALAEELGVRPSPQTEDAYLALLGDAPPATGPVGPAATAALPLPGALLSGPGVFLVGRDDPAARLTAALDRAVTDGRQARFVAGEPRPDRTMTSCGPPIWRGGWCGNAA